MIDHNKRICDRLLSLRRYVDEQIVKSLENKAYTSSYDVENIIYDAIHRLENIYQFMVSVKQDVDTNSDMIDFLVYVTNIHSWSKKKGLLAKSFIIVPQAILNFCNERNLENLAWSVYSIQPESIKPTIVSSLPPILRSAAAITQ